MTFAIATGGIDLSVGGQVTLMGILAATFFKMGMTTSAVMLSIFAMSAGFGAFNGIFISIFKFPAFMVTLALQLITNGFSLYITSGRSIVIDREGFDFWGLGDIWGIQVPIWIFLIAAIVGLILLKRFTIGRRILAVGSNSKGAWYAGISVTKTIIAAYVISGLTAGVSTIILSSKLMNASPSLGSNLELDAIAAVVIGGTSLSGGNGYIIGTVAGALIIEVIGNWLTLQNINPFLREVVKGAIILLALLLDNIRRGKLTKNEFAS
jgi:ribose/xylose/arabinose/galactoside ABC-type transport system permease subunit